MTDHAGYNAMLGILDGPEEEGTAQVRLHADERHLNRAGVVHGGAIMSLVDVAMGRAAASMVDRDEVPPTIEVKFNFLEPGRAGEIVASARVLRRGRRFTVLLAEVWQSEGHEALAESIGTFVSPPEG